MKNFSSHSRRDFLKFSASASLGFAGLLSCVREIDTVVPPIPVRPVGYGPLLPDPHGLLNLPKGFTYQIISRQGETMSDGLLVPGLPDGMGTFRGTNGKTILIRNHELSPDPIWGSPYGLDGSLASKVDRSLLYDPGSGGRPELGGTTTLVYNPATARVERQFLSLTGTARNCAGGPTPWNTWLTCEETIKRAGFEGCQKDHGFVFEVPATDYPRLHPAVPIKPMGRMNHEAVAVDPRTGIVYMTEDISDSLIYRYLPTVPRQLHKGGTLQALMIRDQKSVDTRNWPTLTAPVFPVGQTFDVMWVDLEEVESPDDDLRYQGFDKGAARFARTEGMWFGNNEVYFACTNGGKSQLGQVFRYVPSSQEGKPQEKSSPGKLELFIESNSTELLQNCDNLTVAPWGDVILCEDNDHPFLVGVTPKGELYRLAENVAHKTEFAGGVFSPTGETYFVNMQGTGMTIAITGPWHK
ncbi:alkaline phosphatase PhoX [Telluribacter sp. SYSU D00476]|uniref:alkaline phosphatase PhoX n=1 Tax=Telluribacter sp. SYSU D00476 TaxID=2811430 RepID=UPI001FF43147|nr:alkaline phosphatase PhoX [Telluribacter sp. SYSU D00476]